MSLKGEFLTNLFDLFIVFVCSKIDISVTKYVLEQRFRQSNSSLDEHIVTTFDLALET
jgi:hypothetical protein